MKISKLIIGTIITCMGCGSSTIIDPECEPDGSQEQRTMYEYAAVPNGETCNFEQQERICQDGMWGEWDGSYTEASCSDTLTDDPVCGNGDHEYGEACDLGETDNGVVCVPDYDSSCTYCSDECTEITIQGDYCGDGNCQTDNESSATCVTDCPDTQYSTCDGTSHGETQTRNCYDAPSVPAGSSCTFTVQSRTCDDGNWNPNYDLCSYLTCDVLTSDPMDNDTAIIFLHHSTGNNIWNGGVSDYFDTYNTNEGTSYTIIEQAFPKSNPYGWNNYPYDYWNIWVNHAGSTPYEDEPTLEILTQTYDVIIWKHCYPVSHVSADTGTPNIASATKSQENYKLQYEALKTKMLSYPNTRFVVWTGAALVEGATSQAEAERARDFFAWVRNTWDEAGDNIYVWDFWTLETGSVDSLYLLPENAASTSDSHPNATFSSTAAPLFSQRVIDVIEGRGETGSLTGE